MLLAVLAPVPAQDAVDVVVYGGTSAGVVCAVHLARCGRSVVLVEPGRHLGGLSAGGLGATDIGNKGAIGGLAREFYRRVRRHYAADGAWTRERREDFRGPGHRPDDDAAWTFEPHVAERIFADLVGEAGVRVVRGERLELVDGVRREGGRIRALVMESGRVFRGRIFVDATYEGDLMAGAGVSWVVGRESSTDFGESLNGIQVARATHHQFIRPVDPWVIPGDRRSGLLPGLELGPPEPDGTGDHRVQAYCFRICATDVPENRRTWPKPDGYDPRRYELLLRNFEAGDERRPWHPVAMPNRKTDSNNNFALSTDALGMSHAYPTAGYPERERIVRAHEAWQKGLFWTLANHPRVPVAVRAYFSEWGLARDEFADHDGWPHQLYVREARRMRAAVVMTQAHCEGDRIAPDAVGLAAYTMDSHHVQRWVDPDGAVHNEGDVQVGGFAPYPISYRAIVPLAAECGNLLVPVCLSATHIAYGSIRMEPVFMVLGHSAATAADLALAAGTPLQDVDYGALRERLVAEGQVLAWSAQAPRPVARLDRTRLTGIVLDDGDAALVGTWTESASVGPFLGDGYRHDGNDAKGAKSATFRFTVPVPGRYELRLSYTAHANRARRALVTVTSAAGRAQLRIDQSVPPPLDGAWISLGTFDFTPTSPGVIVIANDDTRGYVIVDAIRVIPR